MDILDDYMSISISPWTLAPKLLDVTSGRPLAGSGAREVRVGVRWGRACACRWRSCQGRCWRSMEPVPVEREGCTWLSNNSRWDAGFFSSMMRVEIPSSRWGRQWTILRNTYCVVPFIIFHCVGFDSKEEFKTCVVTLFCNTCYL